MAVFIAQPMPNQGTFGPMRQYTNGITVRTMTVEDSDFVGRLIVEAFESMFVHVTGGYSG